MTQVADVLVVGAGPAGLTLAWTLQRQGVRARVIDARSAPSADSRATAIHARTLEVLGADLADELVALGRRFESGEVFEGKSLLAEIPLSRTPTPYPFALGLSQAVTERVLRERLERAGLQIEWGRKVVALSQTGADVALAIERSDGSRGEARARWVAGCDGALSTVRDLAGITRSHVANLRWWYLADVRLEGEVPPPDAARVFLSADGVLALLPLERLGWRRLIALGPPVVDGEERPGVILTQLREYVARRAPFDMRIVEHGWLSTFRIHEHVAHAYRAGRVLIAGDAAHAHSPLGGQGMNTGIQDACNLGWKLALVARGAAGDRLLDSYDAERRPIAEALVKATSRGTHALYASAPWVVWVRNRLLGMALGFGPLRDKVRLALAMLSVAYPDSPIVAAQGRAGRVRPGERAPLEVPGLRSILDRPEHVLLDFTRGANDLADDLTGLPIHRVRIGSGPEKSMNGHYDITGDAARLLADAFGVRGEAMIVVRPDGVIGWSAESRSFDALRAWWATITERA